MLPSTITRTTRSMIVAVLEFFSFLVVLFPSVAITQEAYLVTAGDGSLSAYNLSTNSLIESTSAGLGKGYVVAAPNPRLALTVSGAYISVIDLSIQREVQNNWNYYVALGPMVFTPDGQYLLTFDTVTQSGTYPAVLDVLNPSTLQLIHQVPLAAALGAAVTNNPVGWMVVVGHKAYIVPQSPDPNTPTMAVVDLQTLQATAIPIPAGNFAAEGLGVNPPNAAATPDGQYVVVTETEDSDGSPHLLFISTATDSLAMDNALTYVPYGIVAPQTSDPSYGYLVGFDEQTGTFSAVVLDLNSGSPTFGQPLPQTEVDLSSFLPYESALAVNPSGSRLLVSGFHAGTTPQPNVIVIDTAQMLVNPSQAIVATPTVANGAQTNGLTVATISTIMPQPAPAVHAASGRTVNNAPITLHIFGDNFQPGAMVRVGGMQPITATVNSPRDLEVTLPVNAPAGPNQDILVTNPNLSAPPSRQYLSGVLRNAVNIQLNPAFNPRYQFAALDAQDGSVSVYSSSQRAMVNVPLNPPALYSLAFNAGGTDLYTASLGDRYAPRRAYLLDLNVATHAETAIQAGGNRVYAYTSAAASVNPATGKSVMYVWAGNQDITVTMIDTDPSSPTFNTVIRTIAGNLGTDAYRPFSGAATPDGKYVYVSFLDQVPGTPQITYNIAIFDVVHGGNPVVLSTSTLGVATVQTDMFVSPDGTSLLLNYDPPDGSTGIAVLDIATNPLNPTLVTTILADDNPYLANLFSFVVSGNRVFAYDYIGGPVANKVWIFNFDRQHNNYSLLGYAQLVGIGYGNTYIAVSPDASELFVQSNESIAIFDPTHIANGQAPLITNIASYHGPAVMAVSPVPGQNLIRPYAGAPRHESAAKPQAEEEGAASEPSPTDISQRLERVLHYSKNPRLMLEP